MLRITWFVLFGLVLVLEGFGVDVPLADDANADETAIQAGEEDDTLDSEGVSVNSRQERSVSSYGKSDAKIKVGMFQPVICEGLMKHSGRKVRSTTDYRPSLGVFTPIRCSGLEDYLNDKYFMAFDCKEILDHNRKRNRNVTSGVYTIYPFGNDKPGIEAYCDMDTDKGGWTAIQRRVDGRESFYKNWATYKQGFGNASADYWLGNDAIHALTKNGTTALRIDMTDCSGYARYINYSSFRISDESGKYKLTLGSRNSYNVRYDSFSGNNGYYFSTYDRDNDGYSRNCASSSYRYGAWWYSSCGYSNLNGYYRSSCTTSTSYNFWYYLAQSNYYNMKKSVMLIRKA